MLMSLIMLGFMSSPCVDSICVLSNWPLDKYRVQADECYEIKVKKKGKLRK
jgi:hypothetical protein